MIWLCEQCGFEFVRTGPVESCPVCGGALLRPADPGRQNPEKGRQLRAENTADGLVGRREGW